MKRVLVLWVVLATAVPVFAADSLRELSCVDDQGLALAGHDPVAYLDKGKVLEGDPARELVHQGLRFRFAKKKFLKAFREDPERYLPAVGGWAADAMAEEGRQVAPAPDAFLVVDDRLYLLTSDDPEILRRWEENGETLAARADRRWQQILSWHGGATSEGSGRQRNRDWSAPGSASPSAVGGG